MGKTKRIMTEKYNTNFFRIKLERQEFLTFLYVILLITTMPSILFFVLVLISFIMYNNHNKDLSLCYHKVVGYLLLIIFFIATMILAFIFGLYFATFISHIFQGAMDGPLFVGFTIIIGLITILFLFFNSLFNCMRTFISFCNQDREVSKLSTAKVEISKPLETVSAN